MKRSCIYSMDMSCPAAPLLREQTGMMKLSGRVKFSNRKHTSGAGLRHQTSEQDFRSGKDLF